MFILTLAQKRHSRKNLNVCINTLSRILFIEQYKFQSPNRHQYQQTLLYNHFLYIEILFEVSYQVIQNNNSFDSYRQPFID